MGAVCCGIFASADPVSSQIDNTLSPQKILTEAERAERRQIQLDATEARSKNFKQGGGGEKVKAKAKALEEYEKKNKDLGGPNTLKWSAN